MATVYCKYCGMPYSSIDSLTFFNCTKNPNGKKHEPYEGGEKSKYTCKYCGSSYSSIGSLTFFKCTKNPKGKYHEPAL